MIRLRNKDIKKYTTYTIYKITNPTKGVYIGITTNMEKRLEIYRGSIKQFSNQTNLVKSIIKYGWGTHIVEILRIVDCLDSDSDFTIRQLSDIEQFYIMEQWKINPDKTLNVVIKGLGRELTHNKKDI